jgi:hypothetical protein
MRTRRVDLQLRHDRLPPERERLLQDQIVELVRALARMNLLDPGPADSDDREARRCDRGDSARVRRDPD